MDAMRTNRAELVPLREHFLASCAYSFVFFAILVTIYWLAGVIH